LEARGLQQHQVLWLLLLKGLKGLP